MLLAGKRLNDTELNTLSDLIGEQDIEPLLQAANSDRDDAEAARQELISMLMDRHGTSRVLFRNTRNGVKGFPKRELHTIKLPLPTQYQTAIKVSGIMGARKSAEDRARDMLYPEQIYQEFEGDSGTVELRSARRMADGLSDQPSFTEGSGDLRQSGHRAATGAGLARA